MDESSGGGGAGAPPSASPPLPANGQERAARTDDPERDLTISIRQTTLCCPCFTTREHFELLDDALEGEQGAGWLYKRGRRIRAWVKRWFVLKDGMLYYFKDQTRALQKCRGTICIINATVQEVPREGGRFTFELNHRNYETKHFSATSRIQMERWVKGLNRVIQQAKEEGSRDGFLLQRTTKSWQTRWVVVHNEELRCYEEPRDPNWCMCLNLRGCEVRRTISDSGFFAFELNAHDGETGVSVRKEFAAEDYSTRERWIETLYKQSNKKVKAAQEKKPKTIMAIEDDDDDEDEEQTSTPATAAAAGAEQQWTAAPSPANTAMPKDDGSGGGGGGKKALSAAPLPLPHPFISRSSSKRLSSERPPDPLAGFMLKKTVAAGAQGFQKRYFEVRYPGMLYYYKHKPEEGTRPKPKGAIALVDLLDGSPKLAGDSGQDLLIEVKMRVYHIRCAGKEEADKWLTGLRDWAGFALLCSKRLEQQQQPGSSASSQNTLNSLLLPAGDKHEAFRRMASMIMKEDGAKAGVL